MAFGTDPHVKRVLIITPANLTFQWQRELKDKFRENFEVIRSDVLRANYGMNPWQEKERNHQGLDNRLIFTRKTMTAIRGTLRRRQRLGGLLNYYYREAA